MRLSTANKLIKKVKDDYSFIADEFSKTRKCAWQEFQFFDWYMRPKSEILDVGCGNGRLLKTFLKDKKFNSYLGIDISEPLLNEAKKKCRRKNVSFLYGSILDLPLQDKFMDDVFCIAVLHHLPALFQLKALSELKRVMKNDAYLFITVWNLDQKKYRKYAWKARTRAILTLGKYGMNDLFIPWGKKLNRYYYAFTSSRMKRILKNAGFSVKKEILSNYNFCYVCKKE